MKEYILQYYLRYSVQMYIFIFTLKVIYLIIFLNLNIEERGFLESAQINLHKECVNHKQDLLRVHPGYHNVVDYYSKNNFRSPNREK